MRLILLALVVFLAGCQHMGGTVAAGQCGDIKYGIGITFAGQTLIGVDIEGERTPGDGKCPEPEQ